MVQTNRQPVGSVVCGIVFLLACVACQLGRVEQGRVIAYDRSRGIVTLVLDSNPGGHPRYDRLPPVSVRIPQSRSEMGPEPVPGKLLEVQTSPCQLKFFDQSSQRIETVHCQLISRMEDVPATDPRVARLPEADPRQNTLTIYVPASAEILVVSVPQSYLALPAETWRFGDEVRYYFKQPDQALRMMNVTRTRLS